jgi:predicted MPP superfamily phosphohydrolase
MEDFQLKRRLIERGHLKDWSKRGHIRRADHARFLKTLLRIGLRMTGLGRRGKTNALQPVIEHVRFEFDHLPERFEGFRILHLSDIHADGLVELPDVLHEKLKQLQADLCVLTGDYRFAVRGLCDDVYSNMERILAGVNSQHGILGVLGNHDSEAMVPEFERMGVRMLMNESHAIQADDDTLWFIGLDDPHYYGCADLPGAIQQVPEDAFKILLVHTPEVFHDAHEHGIHLYLCGHTHGGQIRLPLVGPVFTHSNAPRKFSRGVWRYNNVQGYTSSGVGCSGVVARFLCPPEIVMIELAKTQTPRTQSRSDVKVEITFDEVSANRHQSSLIYNFSH